MVRFFTIIIVLINLFIIQSWMATSIYLFGFIEKVISFKAVTYIGIGLILCFVIFFIIHSFRFVFYNESARKIQQAICIIDPFIRLIGAIVIINFETEFKLPIDSAVTMISIFTIIDIMIFMYLRRQKTIDVFKAAEDLRDQKFRMKLMKK
ncbi:MAG: hypothetical protein GY714_12280 [Desulfobacterales bacterium]|nr:hypothetical protein [Desulfobacterales bacterium]